MNRFFVATGLLIAFVSSATAEPAMTIQPTAMREAPSAHARMVQPIPAHAEIDIEHCGRFWCAASWRNISGFVAADAISGNDPPPVYRDAPPPGAYLGPPPLGPPPLFGWGWGYGWRPHYY